MRTKIERVAPRLRLRGTLASALLGALAAALIASGCGGGGGGTTTVSEPAIADHHAGRGPVERGQLQPGPDLQGRRPRGGDHHLRLRYERQLAARRRRLPGRPGIRLRGRHRWSHRHQRPRGHQRRAPERRRLGARGQAGLRRVRGPQPGPRAGGRLRRRRRRRPDQGRSQRPQPPAGPAVRSLELHHRRARGGDRQPVRRGSVALDRRGLGDQPDRRGAHQLRHRQRDPDRRFDQPGQLGRPAARLKGAGDRHQ